MNIARTEAHALGCLLAIPAAIVALFGFNPVYWLVAALLLHQFSIATVLVAIGLTLFSNAALSAAGLFASIVSMSRDFWEVLCYARAH